MTLEEEVTELIRGPVQGFQAIYDADPSRQTWFSDLTRDERDELFLLSLKGLADAVTRVAREIDRTVD